MDHQPPFHSSKKKRWTEMIMKGEYKKREWLKARKKARRVYLRSTFQQGNSSALGIIKSFKKKTHIKTS